MTNDLELCENVHVLLLTMVGFLPVPEWDANPEMLCFPSSNQTQQKLHPSTLDPPACTKQMSLAFERYFDQGNASVPLSNQRGQSLEP